MTARDDGRVPQAAPGSREPSPSVPLVSAASGFDPSRIVWQSKLDGIYDCAVVRLGASLGALSIARNSGELIATGQVALSYDAAFGPDIADVADWQAWIMEFLEGETHARNPLRDSGSGSKSEDAGTAAEAEGPQSGDAASGASPKSPSSPYQDTTP